MQKTTSSDIQIEHTACTLLPTNFYQVPSVGRSNNSTKEQANVPPICQSYACSVFTWTKSSQPLLLYILLNLDVSHTKNKISLIFERLLSRLISISVKTTSLPHPCLWQYLESLKTNSIFSIWSLSPQPWSTYLWQWGLCKYQFLVPLCSCGPMLLARAWVPSALRAAHCHTKVQSLPPPAYTGKGCKGRCSCMQVTTLRQGQEQLPHTVAAHHTTAPAQTQGLSKTGVTALQSK